MSDKEGEDIGTIPDDLLDEIAEEVKDSDEGPSRYELYVDDIDITATKHPDQEKFGDEYRVFENETVTGTENIFELTFENRGEEAFPGGELELKMTKPSGFSSVAIESEPVELPPIEPGEETVIQYRQGIMFEGLYTLKGWATSADYESVSLSPSSSEDSHDLFFPMRGIPREDLESLSALMDIREELR